MNRRVAGLALAAVALALAAAAVAPALHGSSPPVEHVTADRLVQPAGDGSAVWPYTSRSQSVDGRTLALTTVVLDDEAAVRRALARADRDWDRTRGHARLRLSPDRWRAAQGSTRYTYVRPADGDGRWATPALQLQAGSYFGARLHVRAYAAPDGSWTALQPHREHWDWFRLRHTVTGVAVADRAVTTELRDADLVTDARSAQHGLTGGGSTGSLTVVELAATLAVVAAGRRLAPRHLALPAAIVAVVFGVRAAGIAVESVAPAIPPKATVVAFYPVLAVGVPAAAVRLGRPLRPLPAAVLAAAALLGALAVDVLVLGLTRVPPPLALHRAALALALGTLAAGAARTDRRLTLVGVVGWLLALAAPLAGFV